MSKLLVGRSSFSLRIKQSGEVEVGLLFCGSPGKVGFKLKSGPSRCTRTKAKRGKLGAVTRAGSKARSDLPLFVS